MSHRVAFQQSPKATTMPALPAPHSTKETEVAKSAIPQLAPGSLRPNLVAGEIQVLDGFTVQGNVEDSKFFFFVADDFRTSPRKYTSVINQFAQEGDILVFRNSEENKTVSIPSFTKSLTCHFLHDKSHEQLLRKEYDNAKNRAMKVQQDDLRRMWKFLHPNTSKDFFRFSDCALPEWTVSHEEISKMIGDVVGAIRTKPEHMKKADYDKFKNEFPTTIKEYMKVLDELEEKKKAIAKIKNDRKNALQAQIASFSAQNPSARIFIISTSDILLQEEARVEKQSVVLIPKVDPLAASTAKASSAGQVLEKSKL